MTGAGSRPVTVGVEEEYLLLDPENGHNAPVAEKVTIALPDALRERSRPEFRHSMLEMVTGVCTTMAELRDDLGTIRSAAAEAAAGTGAMLAAIGATPVAELVREPPDNPRFREIVRHLGPVATEEAVCGCHVHIGVPDRDAGVRAATGLRPWLPVIQALAANSPFYAGADTGHASWRSMQLRRWPLLGPTPPFASAAEYDAAVAAGVASGTMLDDGMVFWYARPSANWPTVEIRVADVCLTADDTVLAAALIRALVTTILDSDSGPSGPSRTEVPEPFLEAAHWNAAHRGLDGTLLDPRTGQAVPAWDLIGDLVTTVAPALSHSGDTELVTTGLNRIQREGTGAARQRRAYELAGDLPSALRRLAVSP